MEKAQLNQYWCKKCQLGNMKRSICEKSNWTQHQWWTSKLEVPNFQIGGARQAAVALQPMHVWKVCQLKSGFLYPDHSNNYTFSWVRAILKPQEASKVKFACFKGIVHPTHFQ